MKYYLITLFISISLAVLTVISMLMINIPQLNSEVQLTVETYEGIIEEDYEFENDKNITDNVSTKEYIVTQTQIDTFESTTALDSGNANPFTPSADLEAESESNDDETTEDKTESSNDGVTNDSTTSK